MLHVWASGGACGAAPRLAAGAALCAHGAARPACLGGRQPAARLARAAGGGAHLGGGRAYAAAGAGAGGGVVGRRGRERAQAPRGGAGGGRAGRRAAAEAQPGPASRALPDALRGTPLSECCSPAALGACLFLCRGTHFVRVTFMRSGRPVCARGSKRQRTPRCTQCSAPHAARARQQAAPKQQAAARGAAQYRARLARRAAFQAGSPPRKLARQREAEALLRRCLALDPTDGRGYVGLGKLLLQQQRCEEARRLYDEGTMATGARTPCVAPRGAGSPAGHMRGTASCARAPTCGEAAA